MVLPPAVVELIVNTVDEVPVLPKSNPSPLAGEKCRYDNNPELIDNDPYPAGVLTGFWGFKFTCSKLADEFVVTYLPEKVLLTIAEVVSTVIVPDVVIGVAEVKPYPGVMDVTVPDNGAAHDGNPPETVRILLVDPIGNLVNAPPLFL